MKDKTPINEWLIKESNLRNIEVDYDPFFVIACKKLLTYLGLQDIPDPKKWVEEMKSEEWCKGYQASERQSIYPKICEQLQAENERLKEELKALKGESNEQ